MASAVPVPKALRDKLESVRERQTRVDVVAGLMKTVAGFLMVMMVAMAIDWFATLFSPSVRVTLTLLSCAVAVLLLARWTFAPLFASRKLNDVAQDVDSAVPYLEERWSTVAEIANSDDSPELLGSSAMIREVSREAEALDHMVEPIRVVSTERTKRGLWGLGASAAVILTVSLIDWQQVSVLMVRFWIPLGDTSLTRVTSVTGDTVVARGESLQIAATLAGRPRDSARLTIRCVGEDSERVTLFPDRDGQRLNHAIKSVNASLEYRIRAGDGQTAWHRVEAVDRPRLSGIELTITPPAYTRLEGTSQQTLPRSIRAIEGSRLDILFHTNQTLRQMELELNGAKHPVAAVGETVYHYTTTLHERIRLSPILTATHGLTNLNPPLCEIVVYPDTAPVVQVITPDDKIAVTPDDTIQVEFKAADDLGIERAQLVVFEPNGIDEKHVIEIPLGDKRGEKNVDGTVDLDLKLLEPKHGDELTYAVRVFDTKNTTASSSANSAGEDFAAKDGNAKSASDTEPAPSQSNDDETDKANQSQVAAAQQNANQPSRQSAEKQPQQDKNLASAAKPPNNMPKRSLDAAGQCASCKPMRLIIDEWAGSFASQAREKLQLQIDPRLRQLDEELAAAEDLTSGLVDHQRAEEPWHDEQTSSLDRSVKHLDKCEQISAELLRISNDTPYAFIGLQLSDIVRSHVEPAGKELQATRQKSQDRLSSLVPALYDIRRARQKQADLDKSYRAQKLNEKLADTMQRITKMHQLFLENTFAMLGSNKPTLNPKQRSMLELDFDEEFLKRLQELLEKKRDIQAELARLLAEDPRLLRRFMARTRLEADSLRDLMTILAERQKQLSVQTEQWVAADGEEFSKIAREHIEAGLQLMAQRMAIDAAKMHENFITWIPLDLDPERDDLVKIRQALQHIATLAGDLAATKDDEDLKKRQSAAKLIYEHSRKIDEQLAVLGEQEHAKLTVHAANRMIENRNLISLSSGWIRKADSLASGEFHLAAGIDQYRLTTDTATLTRKLDNLKSWMAGMPEDVQEAAEKLNLMLHDQLLPAQTSAGSEFENGSLAAADIEQRLAVKIFAESEALFDEVLDKAIAFMDSQKLTGTPSLPEDTSQTLDDLLAMLENEAQACESLGIPCRPTNLSIQKDWITGKPCSGSCSGAAMGGALAQTRVGTEDAARILERYATKKTKKRIGDSGQQTGTAPDSTPRETVRWNRIQSKLEDQLRQVRGNAIPEQYRHAIQQYFQIIVEP